MIKLCQRISFPEIMKTNIFSNGIHIIVPEDSENFDTTPAY